MISPVPGRRNPRRARPRGATWPLWAAPLAVLAAALCPPPSAQAEYKTTTAQAIAAHAEWLPYAPPPEAGAAAVCLVDTGVDLNPDTSSNVIARLALDGGDPGDLSESKHGTQMAMVMGAPINGWGMVGAWPGVRIVSVRAARSTSTLGFDGYRAGVQRCREAASVYPIKVIALALGGEQPTTEQKDRLTDALTQAYQQGLNVVAAAGNTGGDVSEPAASEPLFATGALNESGSICGFSARGPRIDIYAPGCGLDSADPAGSPSSEEAGTSQAATQVASLIAAVRSYRSELGAHEAESLIASSSSATPAGPALNARALFEAAGLSDVTAAGDVERRSETSLPILFPGHALRITLLTWRQRLVRIEIAATVPARRLVVRAFRRGTLVYKRRAQTYAITIRRRATRVCVAAQGPSGGVQESVCRNRPRG